MSETARASNRPLLGTVVLGVVIGVVVSKVMDGWPPVTAEGEQTNAKKQFTEQAETFRQAAKQIAPSVVNITLMKKVLRVEGYTRERGWMGFYLRPKLKEDLDVPSLRLESRLKSR